MTNNTNATNANNNKNVDITSLMLELINESFDLFVAQDNYSSKSRGGRMFPNRTYFNILCYCFVAQSSRTTYSKIVSGITKKNLFGFSRYSSPRYQYQK